MSSLLYTYLVSDAPDQLSYTLIILFIILDYSVGTMEILQDTTGHWNYGPNLTVTYFWGPLIEGPAIYPGKFWTCGYASASAS